MSCNTRLDHTVKVFDAQASNTVIKVNLPTRNLDFIIVVVATADLTDGTLKVRGSALDTTSLSTLDLTAAQSVANIWDHLYLYNLDSAAGTAGTTGVSLGASAYAQFKVNVDGQKTLALEITGMSAGAYTAYVYGLNKFGE